MKQCKQCERTLPIEEFHKGKISYCKVCAKIRSKKWYAKNTKQARFNHKKYYMEVSKENGNIGGNYTHDVKCGVYMFKNIITGEFYIGTSTNMRQRVTRHFSPRGRSRNKHIYKSIKQYGKESFVWGVIEYCEPNVRFEVETKWIQHYKCDKIWNDKKT